MRMMWIGMFACSSLLLAVLCLRSKNARQWIGRSVLHMLVAVFLLYFFNLAGAYADFEIPYNFSTVFTVVLLGVPGLLMLAGLKLVLL